MVQKAIVYVDALNLYYGLLKKTDYKWLDLGLLAESFLNQKNIEILEIKYFCAKVVPKSYDPDAPTRQDKYLKALTSEISSRYGFSIVEGFFKHNVIKKGIDTKTGLRTSIYTDEEKGTDVNIAVHIVSDSYAKKDYDTVFLISNDSDLNKGLQIAKANNKNIMVLPPIKKYSKSKLLSMKLSNKRISRPAGALVKYAHWHNKYGISDGRLDSCQLQNPCNRIKKPISR